MRVAGLFQVAVSDEPMAFVRASRCNVDNCNRGCAEAIGYIFGGCKLTMGGRTEPYSSASDRALQSRRCGANYAFFTSGTPKNALYCVLRTRISPRSGE